MRLPLYFKQQVKLPAKASYVYRWHSRTGAFQRLSPPWQKITLQRKDPGVEAGNQTHFTIHKGLLCFQWIAEHIDEEPGQYFVDLQLKGPFLYWRHIHRFREIDPHASLMEDTVRYLLPGGGLVNSLLKSFVKKRLKRLFRYRARILTGDLEVIHQYPKKTKRILIAGGSGFVGNHLMNFLRAAGHEVWFLSRSVSTDPYAIQWNPQTSKMDHSLLEGFHVIMNLSGENIAKGRWTASRKQAILESRQKTTKLLVNAIGRLKNPPDLFLCASAVGYYGYHTPNETDEHGNKGDGFLADVCEKWEEEALLCKASRILITRFGMILSPDGGALGKMLPAFRMGLGGPFSKGDHLMSWIALDDLLYGIYHLIMSPKLKGVFNLTSPEVVTNAEFVRTLSKLLRKPHFLRVPKAGIHLFFGQMGNETLLASIHATPKKLLDSGFRFHYPNLKHALRHMLGI